MRILRSWLRKYVDVALTPAKLTPRRKVLVKDLAKMRGELPPLGMTTAELVHLAREERKWLYES